MSGGEGGIRTLGTGVSPYNGLANRRIRPLCHLSSPGFDQFTTRLSFQSGSHRRPCAFAAVPHYLERVSRMASVDLAGVPQRPKPRQWRLRGTAETVPFPNSFLKQDVEIRKCTPDAYNHETSSGFAWAKPSAERARKINDDQCCQVPIYWPYLPASQRAISSRSCL